MCENSKHFFLFRGFFYSNFRPDLRNTKIQSKISLPVLKASADFTATMQLLMLNVKPEGVLTIDMSMYFL